LRNEKPRQMVADPVAKIPQPAPAEPILLAVKELRISPRSISVGVKNVPLVGMTSYRIDTRVEEAHRLGNIIMTNLYVGATLAFLIGILSEYLTSRFNLAVWLFGLLSVAAIDDLLRSKGQTLYRLLLQGPKGETLAFVTSDAAMMERAALTLDRLLPRTA
jgi:hypothetical protein